MYIDSECGFCSSPVRRHKQSDSANVRVHFCDIRCKSEYQRLAKPVSEEWLRSHYVDKGMDCCQIALLVKRDPKSVWNWLKDFGIPRRKRGFASNHKFVKGQESAFKGKKHSVATKRKLSSTAIIQKRVPYDPAVGSYMKGRKGDRTPNWKGGITPDRQAFYATQGWKECVKAVWKRDDARCRKCGLDHRSILRGTIRFDLHHIDSFMIPERRSDPDNVVLLCQHCHKWIHSKKNKRRLLIGKGH